MSTGIMRPRFLGTVRGEALKVSRQLSFWLMLAGSVVLLAIITLAITSASNIQDQLKSDPTAWAYGARDIFGTIFQIGSGIFPLTGVATLPQFLGCVTSGHAPADDHDRAAHGYRSATR